MLTSKDPSIEAAHHCGHFVQFYESETGLTEDVGVFLLSALNAGGSAIAIATANHLASLRSWLDARQAATVGCEPRDALILLDAHATLELFMVDGWPDEALFVSTVGAVVANAARADRPLHAFGEMVAILCEQGRGEAALRLEELWNRLGENHRFSLFCAYPGSAFPGAEDTQLFRHICHAHRHVLPSIPLREADNKELHLRLALAEQRARSLEDEMNRRRTAEHQRDAVLMSSPVASALLLGDNHTFQLANPRYLDMVSRSDLIGRAYLDAFPGERDGPIAAALELVSAHGLPIVHEEYRCGRKDSGDAISARDYTLHFEPLRAASGKIDGVIVSAVEVTGYVRARETLEKSRADREVLLAELRKANGAKDEFLAMLGHELRNPLAPIVSALELMELRDNGSATRERTIIQRHVDHLVRLVDDLLDVSRIIRGNVELDKRLVDVHEVVTKAVEMTSVLMEQRSHRLSIDVDPALKCVADPMRLAQVVANLLINAAKYTEAGGEIAVSAAGIDADNLRIRVCDNGIGMAPEVLARVFDTFYQGKQTIDRAEGGLGIGLALVKNFVKLHGGHVEATSDGLGLGSQFTIVLPRASSQAMMREVMTSDAAAAIRIAGARPVIVPREQFDGRGQQRRILLVDDNVDAADALAELLQSYGHSVRTVYDPAAALAEADIFRPAVSVLDIGLPVMDGYELARQLRERSGSWPCVLVALTGYGQTADRERSRAAGFDHHFVKPLRPADLLDVIDGVPVISNDSESPL
ncbi:ATP-binding protein [Paraburkholderia rhynchosiae]|uniref:histidine kinase n=1 Tax=Paraburkholderia rhynchosiae TaxID=487049 RepID=A0A2N7WIQ3_9BURK|nr:ATP-binding protein [Paraburkholderia rhynchosiae]PMS29234.1 histidine kinase [Paraburkholderia rhynchosiae]CAB3708040.1 Sensor histidine kinase RcsC [Paraburkholderia rhynchosiae]